MAYKLAQITIVLLNFKSWVLHQGNPCSQLDWSRLRIHCSVLRILDFAGVFSGLKNIVKTEKFIALYKGNGAQMVRIFPYAATQFTAFEIYKKVYWTRMLIWRHTLSNDFNILSLFCLSFWLVFSVLTPTPASSLPALVPEWLRSPWPTLLTRSVPDSHSRLQESMFTQESSTRPPASSKR